MSLGVPVYNAERYLDQCLSALLAQDYPDFEIIISDNASTDRTWAICRHFADRDPRIRLHRHTRNVGGPANYARVVDLARGEFFKWVAYDDLCRPAYLRSCVTALDAGGPTVLLAYPRTLLIDEENAVIGPYVDGLDLRSPRPWRRVARAARRLNLCHAHFGLFRLAALRRTGLVRPYLSSDYTLVAEVAQLGQIHEVPEPLFLRRMHGASTRQGNGGLTAAVTWFAPAGQRVQAPRLRMLYETVRALLHGDVPLGTRLSGAAAFLLSWELRRVRNRLGRLRRRLTGVAVPDGLDALVESVPASSPTARSGR